MRARWVSERPDAELPIVGQAIVASWWPGRYHFVSTIELDPRDPLRRLTDAVRTGEPYDQVVTTPDAFLTSVYRCDKSGLIYGDPLYEREYKTLSEAKGGHRGVLLLLSNGSLERSPSNLF